MKEELKRKTNMKRNFETSQTMIEMSQSPQSFKDKERMNDRKKNDNKENLE